MLAQLDQKVQLTLTLRTSAPHSISITDACPESPLRLLASITQTASPFPTRAITILTYFSCLDASAFLMRAMTSPVNTRPDGTPRELPLRPTSHRLTFTRVSGDPDLRSRPEDEGFCFLTIPPIGEGSTEIVLADLWPADLVGRLPSATEDEPLQDKLRRLFRPGDAYRIAPRDLDIRWWTFGSLSEGLRGKKVARWSLPDELSLVREPGEDETEYVGRRLQDLVDLHDVNHLSSRSAVEGEERPVVAEMRADGWVFGEPPTGLKLVYEDEEDEAVFSIVE